MRQIEPSRSLVFDAPRRARAFVEALIADNLCLGRPDELQLIFSRQARKNTPGFSPPRWSTEAPRWHSTSSIAAPASRST